MRKLEGEILREAVQVTTVLFVEALGWHPVNSRQIVLDLFPIDLVLDQGQSLARKHLRPNASSIFSLAPNAASDIDHYRHSACER